MSLSKLERLTLADVASELAIHPFDLIRILVAERCVTDNLRFDRPQVDVIRRAGGIETWWTADSTRSDDSILARGLLRDVCEQLVARGVVGDNATRLDNVLRGLETSEQHIVRALVQGLIQLGVLGSRSSARGLYVSIVEGREYAVADLAEGGDVPEELAELWS